MSLIIKQVFVVKFKHNSLIRLKVIWLFCLHWFLCKIALCKIFL